MNFLRLKNGSIKLLLDGKCYENISDIRLKNKNHIQSLVRAFDRKHKPLGIIDCEWQNAAVAFV